MIRTFTESELILYADGELDREDVPAIEAFIAKNPEAEEFVRKVRKANELVLQSHYPDMRIFDEGEKEEFFLKVKDRSSRTNVPYDDKKDNNVIGLPLLGRKPGLTVRHNANDNRWISIAASLILVAVIGYTFWGDDRDEKFAQVLDGLDFPPVMSKVSLSNKVRQSLEVKMINYTRDFRLQLDQIDVIKKGDELKMEIIPWKSAPLTVEALFGKTTQPIYNGEV